MLSSVDRRDYAEVGSIHAAVLERFPLVRAVVREVQAGQIFADTSRRTCFIATKSGFSLLASVEHRPADDAGLLEFLRGNESIPGYLHLYDPPPSFRDYIGWNWPQSRLRCRAQFRGTAARPGLAPERRLPPGHRLATIQQVDADCLRVFALELEHRYWDSDADLRAHAIGACLIGPTGRPLAICYAACVVDGLAEVDVVTLAEHRGKGFGRLAAEAFLKLAGENRLTAHWDAFTSNVPSCALAETLGLQRVREYPLLSVFCARIGGGHSSSSTA